ncbi:heavy metal-associated isoprenylated plant protein 2-like [Henckelia pumila]|uniref:heavy metal-associated isoprenylated plant protein 2-like n=1 Tax=Henckelia pumila TaxID=405737 RepID=UPI003C6E583B
MVQKTVLRVDVSCEKCKKKIIKAVLGLPGVDKVEVDGGKGILSVIGNADPYDIIVRTRKAAKFVEVVSVGPPPAPQKQEAQKKPEEKKAEGKKRGQSPAQFPFPLHYPVYEGIRVVPMTRWEEPPPTSQCSIL